MKNLHLINVSKLLPNDKLVNCLHGSVDFYSNQFYYGFRNHISILNLSNGLIIDSITIEGEDIVTIQFLVDQSALFIVTSNGELFLWNRSSEIQLESVGIVNSGIKSVSWSYDFELLTLVTGNDSMILMNRDFEPITEQSLQDLSSFGEAELVTVGWGKKETQFHGSEGKKAAVSKEVLNTIPVCNDRSIHVTWRGDGQYFAINYVDSKLNCRKFKVWSRDGHLHSTSAPVNGLGQAMSFKTQGNLIAGSKISNDEVFVAFFEKNSLQHGEFLLPYKSSQLKIVEICWNLDSTILSLLCSISTGEEHEYKVLLYTTSNYHWYLKKTFSFTSEKIVRFLLWDQECAMKLHFVTSDGSYYQYKLNFSIDISDDVTLKNKGTIAVIDGNKVLVTSFDEVVIPPPMCAYSVQFTSQVQNISFGRNQYINEFIILTDDGVLHWFSKLEDIEYQKDLDSLITIKAENSKFLPKIKGNVKLTFSEPIEIMMINHLVWINSNIIVLVYSSSITLSSTIKVVEINWKDSSLKERIETNCFENSFIEAIVFNSTTESIFIELNNATCWKFDYKNGSLKPWINFYGVQLKFPRLCTKVSLLNINNKEYVVALSAQYRFYIEDFELIQDCLSYAIHSDFLLLTTQSHTLKAVLINSIPCLNKLKSEDSGQMNEIIRNVERGSKIVGVIPYDTKVILQMPRGNLEVIHPRCLLLFQIKKFINNLQFLDAFVLCKKHRINMSILTYHNTELFLENIDLFIKQLDTYTNINLFLTDLSEENVCKTMYASFYSNEGNKLQCLDKEVKNVNLCKSNQICETLFHALQNIDADKYFLSILMTFVKKNPPDLEGCLQHIKELKDQSNNFKTTVNDSLKFIFYLVDINQLYDVALGTYDFSLVLMIAEKSQKDPKEYLPYLKELDKHNEYYKRYLIDIRLKKYTSALVNISKCDSSYFETLLKLIKDHKLFNEALHLYDSSSEQFKTLAVSFGEYLFNNKKYIESGMLFWKGEDYKSALEAFIKGLDWKLTLCMTNKLKYTKLEITNLAKQLAAKLIDAHNYLDAALLFDIYAKDNEEAIVTLIKGHLWDDALRMIYNYNRMDFIESDFKPALIACYNTQTELINRTLNNFNKYKERLNIVRIQTKENFHLYESGDIQNPNSDLYSDTSSLTGESLPDFDSKSSTSNNSKTSGRSIKTQKKKEKKKWSLREGNPTEEFALIEALKAIYKIAETLKDELHQLMKALYLFNYTSEKIVIETEMTKFLINIEAALPTIWNLSSDSSPNDNENKRQGNQSLDIDETLNMPPIMNKSKSWKLTI